MSGQVTGETAPWRFGAPGRDPVELGRRGGIRSGEIRRLRPLREWEAGIKESRNGAAKAIVYKDKRAELAELLKRQVEADRTVMWLDQEAENLRATINDLRDEIDRARNARHALFVRVDALKATLAASEPELVDRLKALDAAGGLDHVLERTGVLERSDDEAR